MSGSTNRRAEPGSTDASAASDSRVSAPRSIRRGVIGIIGRGRSLLLIRRAAGVAKGGCWCFPGGHVEPGETPRRALQRELAEELGIETRATERVGSVRLTDSGYVLAVWRAEHVGGELAPHAAEIAEVRWATPEQIRSINPGLPSNERVLEMLGL